jgi:hypothetical protein
MEYAILFLVLYFVPSLLGFGMKHKSSASILVVNLFLGWTFVGWVVALAWALMPEKQS